MGDVINCIGNDSRANAVQVLAVVWRVGALGELAGVHTDDIAALAATFVETSSSVEVAGTGFENFLDALTAGSTGR